jgi:hypothetical protein
MQLTIQLQVMRSAVLHLPVDYRETEWKQADRMDHVHAKPGRYDNVSVRADGEGGLWYCQV